MKTLTLTLSTLGAIGPTLILAACGGQPASTATPSVIPDTVMTGDPAMTHDPAMTGDPAMTCGADR